MCISQNRGGHHGRLVIPANLADGTQERLPVKRRKLHHDRPPTKRERSSRVIPHDYHDHKKDSSPEDYHVDSKDVRFPIKLHLILEHADENGYADIISWDPHGRSFRVHKQSTFMKEVLPTYFTLHKFPSFQRQLNLYGFQRITQGPDKGGYYHELFLRGKPFLAHQMERTRIKGTKVRPKTDPSKEPDFYAMPPVDSDEPLIPRTASRESEESSDDEEEVETSRAPSPSVVDTRTATQKLGSAFPNETVSSTVIPYESASSHISDAYKSDVDDNDLVIIFEGRPFHYLDPYGAIRERPSVAPPTLVPSHPHEHEQKIPCRKPEPEPRAQRQEDNDHVIIFEGRPFHYLNPHYEAIRESPSVALTPTLVSSHPHEQMPCRKQEPEPRAQRQEDSQSTISEIDAKIARLNEPGGIWSINVNSMDDESFGTLLKNLVISGSERCTYSV